MLFERPDTGERAVVVRIDVDRPHLKDDEGRPGLATDPALAQDPEDDLQEFLALVRSAGVEPVAVIGGHRKEPSPRTFVGSGKLEEIRAAVLGEEAEVVLFDHELSPVQERNLEAELECRVVGRTGVILDIFAQRARTREGLLQVELAQLNHMSTRLVRGWTHLDRQKGGIGLRGAGETQLELDQRIIGDRIKAIGKRLDKVRTQRSQGRRARDRANVNTLSLVGYTNAGKSTLFNALTEAGVTTANQLFATLDPTLRRITVGGIGDVVLADTVGFISRLPHRLVDAFRATLEEVATADLLLHVMDASAPGRAQQAADVDTVLREIGAAEVPVLEVWNKIDATDLTPGIERDANGLPLRVRVSALAESGLDLLLEAVAERLGVTAAPQVLQLSPQAGATRAWLYQRDAVVADQPSAEGGWLLRVRLPELDLQRLQDRPGVTTLEPNQVQQMAVAPTAPLQPGVALPRMRDPAADASALSPDTTEHPEKLDGLE